MHLATWGTFSFCRTEDASCKPPATTVFWQGMLMFVDPTPAAFPRFAIGQDDDIPSPFAEQQGISFEADFIVQVYHAMVKPEFARKNKTTRMVVRRLLCRMACLIDEKCYNIE